MSDVSVRFDESGAAEVRALDGPAAESSFVYLDCGAWLGDGRNSPRQRSFGLVCGSVVLLCEFQAGAPLREVVEGPAEEVALANKVLRALAGPQRMDVTVRVGQLAPAGSAQRESAPEVTLFLPDMHFPLVPKLPDLDPNLVPDPTVATCWCHGPIFARIDGTARNTSVYRAVGSFLSRNPNDWFYLLAGSYRNAAEDLVRFLERLARLGTSIPVSLVQLGGLFEVWAGFRCAFAANGRAAFVEPRIVAGVGEAELDQKWSAVMLETPVRNAISRLLRVPASRRRLIAAAPVHWEPASLLPEPPSGSGPRFVRTQAFFAESRPEPLRKCDDHPPYAVLGLREQQAQFIPWVRNHADGWREELIAGAAARWAEQPFGVYVMSHTHVPSLCLVRVRHGAPPPFRKGSSLSA